MQGRRNKPSLSLGERHATAGEGIRRLLITLSVLLLTACGQGESAAQVQSIDELLEQVRKDATNQPDKRASDAKQPNTPLSEEEQEQKIKEYRAVLQRLGVIHENPDLFPISCTGVFEQGGAVKCKTFPSAYVEIGEIKTKANKNGDVVIGFDRDAPAQETISVRFDTDTFESSSKIFAKTFEIAPREYTISRIDGLPPSQVSNYSKEQLARIRSSSARKKKGFASREQTMWFRDGFDYPLKDFVKTSPFGAQRILNGIKKKPHYGVDIAAPVGTPIYAPADGVVSLADDDLYFEGAMVLLDHGQGLISMYLHMDAIDVKPGQVVKRGEKLGEVGSKGRSTGPHLCWRLKWRNRHLDPELLTQWPSHEDAND